MFPMFEKVDSIEKMTSVRSIVGVQWVRPVAQVPGQPFGDSGVGCLQVLFTSVMNEARRAINMIRTLQQMVGHVERVTELLEVTTGSMHQRPRIAQAPLQPSEERTGWAKDGWPQPTTMPVAEQISRRHSVTQLWCLHHPRVAAASKCLQSPKRVTVALLV